MDTLEIIAKSLDRVDDTTRETNNKVSEIATEVAELKILQSTGYNQLSKELASIKLDYMGNPETGIKGFKSEFKSDFDRLKLKVTIAGVIIAVTLLAIIPNACSNEITYVAKIYKAIYALL